MNIKHLHSFLILCDEGHYGRAANRLFITQPSLSQQIKQLETSLKVILFRRKGRGIELTKAGVILQKHATKIMLSLKNAENDLQPYLYRQRDNISLGVFGSYLILPIFKRFMEKHPDVSLHVKEYSSEKTIKKLCDSSVDVGIVYQCDLPSHLATTVLFEDEIILAVPLTHPLAKFDTIKPEHLNGMSVIILNDMLLLRKVIVSELEKNKIIPNIICELDNHYSCLEYAEAQIGIAFVTRSLFGSLVPKNVRLVSLDIPAFFRPVMLVHNRELLLDEPTCALITQIKNFYTTEMQSSLRKDVVCA